VSYDSADEQIQGVIRSIHSPECSPEGNMERLERRAALRKALRLVGPQLQEAVILRDVQGLTYQEISQLLETPVGTVKSRVNRGRIELARLVRQRAALLPGFESKASAVA
jgi:RNA polymerase sigma-70 factor (ECF subfamily)